MMCCADTPSPCLRVMTEPRIILSPARIAKFLAAIAIFLVLASTAGQIARYLLGYPSVFGFVRFFYLNSERNISTAFAVTLLLLASLLLAVVTLLERGRGSKYVWHWAVLSFGFLFMAGDEGIGLHERLNRPVFRLFEILGITLTGVLAFTWIIPAALLVTILGVVYTKFLRALPADSRNTFLLAGALYLGGAIGMEMLAAPIAEVDGAENVRFAILATIEETLEMCGVILFVWGLLRYLENQYGEFAVVVGEAPANQRTTYIPVPVGRAAEQEQVSSTVR